MISTDNMVTITDSKPRVLDNFPLILSSNILFSLAIFTMNIRTEADIIPLRTALDTNICIGSILLSAFHNPINVAKDMTS